MKSSLELNYGIELWKSADIETGKKVEQVKTTSNERFSMVELELDEAFKEIQSLENNNSILITGQKNLRSDIEQHKTVLRKEEKTNHKLNIEFEKSKVETLAANNRADKCAATLKQSQTQYVKLQNEFIALTKEMVKTG